VTKNIRETVEKHRQIIIIAILGAVLASYLIPFDTLYQIATAQDTGPEPGDNGQPPNERQRPPSEDRGYAIRGGTR
jgi:hypothetical protein